MNIENEAPTQKLDVQTLKTLYTVDGLSDAEIAKRYNLNRSTVSQKRKTHHIPTRQNTTVSAIEAVTEALLTRGFTVDRVKESNKLTPYNFLINNKLRVQVLAASLSHGDSYRITLTESTKLHKHASTTRIQLPNGRFKKDFSKTCDILICVGIHKDDHNYWIIPSDRIPDMLQTLTLKPLYTQSKYDRYYDAWHLLAKKIAKRQTDMEEL